MLLTTSPNEPCARCRRNHADVAAQKRDPGILPYLRYKTYNAPEYFAPDRVNFQLPANAVFIAIPLI
jgi:hypothetical protein